MGGHLVQAVACLAAPLVIRKAFATVPVTVEYAATPPGELLVATRGRPARHQRRMEGRMVRPSIALSPWDRDVFPAREC